MNNPDRGHSLDVENETNSSSQRLPVKNVPNRFEQTLTVPTKLQKRLFRWQSEFDICDQAAGIGRALDVVTDMYHKFAVQFSALADSRMRLMQSPSEFMVTSMYFADRALDDLLHAVARVRRNINTLFDALGDVQKVVAEKRDSAERMSREVEMMAQPQMLHFVEERKAKAVVFLELSNRIGRIRGGGSSMFNFLHKPWCTNSAFCVNIMGPPEGDQTGPDREGSHMDAVLGGVRNDSGPNAIKRSPNKTVQAFACDVHNLQSRKELSGQPKTPDSKHMADDGPKTQVSSPRQRNSSVRKRARASRMAAFDVDAVPVARNLIPDSLQGSQELESLKKGEGSNENCAPFSDKNAPGSQPTPNSPVMGNGQPCATGDLANTPQPSRLRSQRIRRRTNPLVEGVMTQPRPS